MGNELVRIITNLKGVVKLLLSEYHDEQAVYVEEAIELIKELPTKDQVIKC